MPAHWKWPLTAISLSVPLIVWTLLSVSDIVPPRFLPTPLAVIRAGVKLWDDGFLLNDILWTTRRIGIGFALIVAFSVPVGLAMGSFAGVRGLLEPMIGFVRYMPAPAFIPLFILWLGLGEAPKIAVLFVGTVFFNTLMSADVAALVPKTLINASYTLGASRWVVMRKVILPHSIPGLLDCMRVNMAATFNLLVVAELLASQEGLGYRIQRAARFSATDQIFAMLFVLGLIGVAMDMAFRLLRNVSAPWAR